MKTDRLSPDEADTIYGNHPATTKQIDESFASRRQYVNDLRGMSSKIPELPDSNVLDLYERLIDYERRVAPTLSVSDYAEGTAKNDDEIFVANSDGLLAVSADHATDPVRKSSGVREGADHGTGALAYALHDDSQAGIVLPVGRQTGNANVNVEHPMKRALSGILPGKRGFISIHGMKPGKFEHQFDPTEIHAVLGLGSHPSDETLNVAHDFVEGIKREHGLNVVIGNDTRFFDSVENPRLQRDQDGQPIYSARLAALGEGSTTNFVSANHDIPAMQVEISRSLRLLPHDIEYRKDQARKVAVYMGYMLVRSLADGVQKL